MNGTATFATSQYTHSCSCTRQSYEESSARSCGARGAVELTLQSVISWALVSSLRRLLEHGGQVVGKEGEGEGEGEEGEECWEERRGEGMEGSMAGGVESSLAASAWNSSHASSVMWLLARDSRLWYCDVSCRVRATYAGCTERRSEERGEEAEEERAKWCGWCSARRKMKEEEVRRRRRANRRRVVRRRTYGLSKQAAQHRPSEEEERGAEGRADEGGKKEEEEEEEELVDLGERSGGGGGPRRCRKRVVEPGVVEMTELEPPSKLTSLAPSSRERRGIWGVGMGMGYRRGGMGAGKWGGELEGCQRWGRVVCVGEVVIITRALASTADEEKPRLQRR